MTKQNRNRLSLAAMLAVFLIGIASLVVSAKSQGWAKTMCDAVTHSPLCYFLAAESQKPSAVTWTEAFCTTPTPNPVCELFRSSKDRTVEKTIADLQQLYLKKLESWVSESRDINAVQDQVVSNCGMLTILKSPPEHAQKFLRGEEREEFDSRVDACTKLTVHRVQPQPEFQNPKTIKLVCEQWTDLLRELCTRAKLKP